MESLGIRTAGQLLIFVLFGVIVTWGFLRIISRKIGLASYEKAILLRFTLVLNNFKEVFIKKSYR
ncbi:MAG TPA: hypothetical protein DEF27_08855 [Oscillatoriales bacterium UBA8482]|nr:MAG: hypothetical protein AUK43_08320 [Oscillatoriales cyanobacterium CG2_30_40_61]HBW57893.1 hypothetical protein [Oscillatoriales bacterium UBA8482]